jgi:hypothetical protein
MAWMMWDGCDMGEFNGLLRILLDPIRYRHEWLFIRRLSMLMMLIIILVFSSGICMADNINFCVDYPLDFADWSRNASLQKFDPSLGELTGAQITMNLTLERDFALSNKRDLPTNISLVAGANLTLQLPNEFSLVVESSKNGTIMLDSMGEKSFNESDKQSKTFNVGQDQLNDFVGSSSGESLDLPVQVKTVSSFDSDGASGCYIITRAGASICVIYEYAPNDAAKSAASNGNESDQIGGEQK